MFALFAVFWLEVLTVNFNGFIRALLHQCYSFGLWVLGIFFNSKSLKYQTSILMQWKADLLTTGFFLTGLGLGVELQRAWIWNSSGVFLLQSFGIKHTNTFLKDGLSVLLLRINCALMCFYLSDNFFCCFAKIIVFNFTPHNSCKKCLVLVLTILLPKKLK